MEKFDIKNIRIQIRSARKIQFYRIKVILKKFWVNGNKNCFLAKFFQILLDKNIPERDLRHFYKNISVFRKKKTLKYIISFMRSREARYRLACNVVWSSKLKDLRYRYEPVSMRGIPYKSNFAAVIVETRRHPDLKAIVCNVLSKLGAEWSLYIFYSKSNSEYLRKIFSDWHHIHFYRIESDIAEVADYNRLLMSSRFWEKISAEHILIFQTDSLLRQPLDKSYLKYSFIGAPWESPLPGTDCQVGNGGLSLRRKSMMLKVLRKETSAQQINEDIYYSLALYKDQKAIFPDVHNAKKFSVENVYYDDPVGLHKPLLSYEKVFKLLSSI